MLCLFFPHDISKTDAARITKLDTVMFAMSIGLLETHLLWGLKGQVKVTSHKIIAGVGLYTLVSASFL